MKPKIDKNPRRHNVAGFNPVGNFILARNFRENRLWTLQGGELCTFVDGNKLTVDEFNAAYPVPCSIPLTRVINNADTTKNYLL